MKKIFIAIALFLSCIFFDQAFAANTIIVTGNKVHITDIDSDWSWSDSYPQYAYPYLVSIQFNPAAADDQCIIKEGSDSGAPFFDVTAIDEYNQKAKMINVYSKPVLDFSDGTYSAGSSVILIFDFRK